MTCSLFGSGNNIDILNSIRQPKGSQKVGSDSRGVMLAFTREQACASVTFWEKERQSEMRSRFFMRKSGKPKRLAATWLLKLGSDSHVSARCMLGLSNRASLLSRSWSLRDLTGSSPFVLINQDTVWFYHTVSWLAPQVGLEPTTLRLTAACSTD